MITLEEWRRSGTFMTFRGHRIFCREAGAPGAPALVLVHGFPTASWDWEALWPALAAEHHVLTLDMLGFGFSDKPRGHSYSIMEQADIFEQMLRERGVHRVHILAHDYGDTVAQELLARHHDGRCGVGIASVCFLNGGLFPETHRPLLMQKILRSPLGPLAARLASRAGLAAGMRRIFAPGTPPAEALLDGFWVLLQCNEGALAMPRLIRYMDERRRHRARWVGALQRPDVPLKLIDGADDPVSGRHMADRYRELVPAADITLLEGVGHYPQVEAPVAVLQAYAGFRGGLER